MKTNRYVTQSAVVLGLFALLTVLQVVGHADEANGAQFQLPQLKLWQIVEPLTYQDKELRGQLFKEEQRLYLLH